MHEFSANTLSETLPRRMRLMRELSTGTRAGLWLSTPTPSHPSGKWASGEWQMLLLWRLGSTLGLPPTCVACGACQDIYGDHALCCTSMGTYKRHNHIRDTLALQASAIGLQCRTEVELRGTGLVPADVFIPAMSDVPTAVDVSVVHPLQPSHHAQAAITTGAAAEARADGKVGMYAEKCRLRSWEYWAVVAETTGAWNQAGQRFMRRLARARALRLGELLTDALTAVWISVCRALAHAVARQLVRARQPIR